MKDSISSWREFLTEHEDDVNAGAGILLFNSEGDVLLSKRSKNVSNPLTIGTVGGHLTKGEVPSEGAKREFHEEAGYSGPFHGMKLLKRQNKPDGFRYYTFIAKTDNNSHDYMPLGEYQHEIVWNKWIPFEKAIELPNLHPGLKDLFSSQEALEKIRSFLGKG